jgi:deoxyguanosine kinase
VWLAIEGIIGAGKTTTAELLADRTELTGVIERSDEHPFLDAYYRDPERYAFETEIAFMLLQAHQLGDVADAKAIVTDYAPAKNWIFARKACTSPQLALLEEVERSLWEGLPRPDLVVLLDVPPARCLERIASRGRPYERGIGVEDLESLRADYLTSLDELGAVVETIRLEGTESREAVAESVVGLVGLA